MNRRHTGIALGVLVAIAVPVTLWGRGYLGQVEPPGAIAAFSDTFFNPEERAVSATTDLSAEDEAQILAVIQQQLAAFAADDAEQAFSLASPRVQERFQTADQFLAMVRAEYETVYRPQSVNFEALEWIHNYPVQAVTMVGPAGEWMTAYYQMEKQADASWRIAGCLLVPLTGETI